MEQRIFERVSREFKDSNRDTVLQLLESYTGPETDRVRWDILELSKGGVEKVYDYINAAQTDYRDILYWAEYYTDDPMLRGRDPKKMVDEILTKWAGRGRFIRTDRGQLRSIALRVDIGAARQFNLPT